MTAGGGGVSPNECMRYSDAQVQRDVWLARLPSHRSFRHRAVRGRQECASGGGREAHPVGRAQDAVPHASPRAKTPARMSRRATSCTDAQSGANASDHATRLAAIGGQIPDRTSGFTNDEVPRQPVWLRSRLLLRVEPRPKQRRLHGRPGGKPALLRKRCRGLVAAVAHQARWLFLVRRCSLRAGRWAAVWWCDYAGREAGAGPSGPAPLRDVARGRVLSRSRRPGRRRSRPRGCRRDRR